MAKTQQVERNMRIHIVVRVRHDRAIRKLAEQLDIPYSAAARRILDRGIIGQIADARVPGVKP